MINEYFVVCTCCKPLFWQVPYGDVSVHVGLPGHRPGHLPVCRWSCLVSAEHWMHIKDTDGDTCNPGQKGTFVTSFPLPWNSQQRKSCVNVELENLSKGEAGTFGVGGAVLILATFRVHDGQRGLFMFDFRWFCTDRLPGLKMVGIGLNMRELSNAAPYSLLRFALKCRILTPDGQEACWLLVSERDSH